ncbi:MAG TPA: chromosomal replication initiator protein DnaA [Saprospiraceae bacterium]|nr:chromosomal replication initiator protein DnaA [Saprospiraceae bacterium]
MEKSHISVWDNCLHSIKKFVDSQAYKTWFVPIKPIQLNDASLTIQVPNNFFYEWIEEHYVSLLRTSIKRELGENGKLEYQILTSGSSSGRSTKSYSPSSSSASIAKVPSQANEHKKKENEIKNPFVIPGIRRIKIDPQINRSLQFHNFIEGDCNKLARSAAYAVAKSPGKTAFNPLVIYGNSGLGKTHLAHAVGNSILANHEDTVVLYVSSDVFTNQVVQSIKNNAADDFVHFYQMVDVLIIDDIQFLERKQKTQEIFFHIFNQLHQNNKQVIMTSDRPPKDLDGLEDRLISRFKWGLTADLQEPDYETRMAIFEDKMAKNDVDVPYEVRDFICYNIHGNVRELEGIVVSLAAQMALTGKTIDMDLAKSVVNQYINKAANEVNVDFILSIVSESFEIGVEQLKSKSRKRDIVIGRQVAMYLAKKYTDVSLKELGKIFGGRDHSTVIYSINTMDDLLETDDKLSGKVDLLVKQIKSNLK